MVMTVVVWDRPPMQIQLRPGDRFYPSVCRTDAACPPSSRAGGLPCTGREPWWSCGSSCTALGARTCSSTWMADAFPPAIRTQCRSANRPGREYGIAVAAYSPIVRVCDRVCSFSGHGCCRIALCTIRGVRTSPPMQGRFVVVFCVAFLSVLPHPMLLLLQLLMLLLLQLLLLLMLVLSVAMRCCCH